MNNKMAFEALQLYLHRNITTRGVESGELTAVEIDNDKNQEKKAAHVTERHSATPKLEARAHRVCLLDSVKRLRPGCAVWDCESIL